jgi:hypothetical protein
MAVVYYDKQTVCGSLNLLRVRFPCPVPIQCADHARRVWSAPSAGSAQPCGCPAGRIDIAPLFVRRDLQMDFPNCDPIYAIFIEIFTIF